MRELWQPAERDEACNQCGYPFDTGDRVLIWNDGRGYCSRFCAKRVQA